MGIIVVCAAIPTRAQITKRRFLGALVGALVDLCDHNSNNDDNDDDEEHIEPETQADRDFIVEDSDDDTDDLNRRLQNANLKQQVQCICSFD